MGWKSGPLPIYTEFIRVYKTFINWLIIFKPRTALADLERLHYFIAEAINHLSAAIRPDFGLSKGREVPFNLEVANCDLKFPRRPPITSLRFNRIRHSDGCKCLEQRTCSSDEYGVRGRRWMDCIGRMVMRPSVSGERESTCLSSVLS
jgi:hypothetical protein